MITHPFRYDVNNQRPLSKGFMLERDDRLDHIFNEMNISNRFPETG